MVADVQRMQDEVKRHFAQQKAVRREYMGINVGDKHVIVKI
jgi:hypothetical protein